MVDAGDKPVQVVCGAPNAMTGMKSVFSPVGTYIPGKKITLAKGVIRGIEFERHAVLGGRARAFQRPYRHHRTARRRAGRRRLRDLRRPRRSGDRRVADPQPARRDRRFRHRPRSRRRRPRQAEDPRAAPGRRKLRLSDRGQARLRARRRAPLPRLRAAPGARRQQRPVAGVDAEAAAGDRPEADQRAGRHHQLRHLRPRPAAARVRRRQGQGRAHVRRARAGESVLALDGKTYALDDSMVVIADDDGVEFDRRRDRRRAFGLRREHPRRAGRERAVGPAQHRPDRTQARHRHRCALSLRARRRSRFLRPRRRAGDASRHRLLRRRAVAADRRRRSGQAEARD